ncbi:ketopantoate reductase family protein [Clostridium sp. DL1XJH146]
MKKIQKIGLIGAGAIGASYCAQIVENTDLDFKIIASNERINRYTNNGIIINEKKYDFKYLRAEEDKEILDLIIVAVKYQHLEQTMVDMKNFVGENTIILSLLNGISSEEILAKKYNMENILYGICVEVDAVRENGKIFYSNLGYISFGDKNNKELSKNVALVKEAFDNAKMPYKIPENMYKDLWWKFMVNVGTNQPSAIMRAPYGVFQKVKEAKEIMIEAMKEVVEISRCVGVDLEYGEIEKFTEDILYKLSPQGKTSMLQDVEAGRKTEVEMFAGSVCEMGRKYGIKTPVSDMMLRMIKTIEQRY